MSSKIQYQYQEGGLIASEPNKYVEANLKSDELVVNLGPQHPSTHGVLRLEVLTDNEIIKDVIPHIGYLHRCFEKHAEALPYNQIIP
ncbi:MAG: NADH-quinone oxidoreductase subunit D, partial [Fulvivirga sp.]